MHDPSSAEEPAWLRDVPETDRPARRAAAIEAILFTAGDPVAVEDLMKTLGCSLQEVEAAVTHLEERLRGSVSGFELVRAPEGLQMITAAAMSEPVQRFVEAGLRTRLSAAAAETLAVIAYRGPLRRAMLEEIRGVNCSFTIRHLLLRGLIERTARDEHRAAEYQITAQFLRDLGVSRVEQLPDYEALHNHPRIEALVSIAHPEATVENVDESSVSSDT